MSRRAGGGAGGERGSVAQQKATGRGRASAGAAAHHRRRWSESSGSSDFLTACFQRPAWRGTRGGGLQLSLVGCRGFRPCRRRSAPWPQPTQGAGPGLPRRTSRARCPPRLGQSAPSPRAASSEGASRIFHRLDAVSAWRLYSSWMRCRVAALFRPVVSPAHAGASPRWRRSPDPSAAGSERAEHARQAARATARLAALMSGPPTVERPGAATVLSSPQARAQQADAPCDGGGAAAQFRSIVDRQSRSALGCSKDCTRRNRLPCSRLLFRQ